jgi:hypothetical protein
MIKDVALVLFTILFFVAVIFFSWNYRYQSCRAKFPEVSWFYCIGG